LLTVSLSAVYITLRLRCRILQMRTYSHAVLTMAAARHTGVRGASWAVAGAVLPDLPSLVGATRLRAFGCEAFFGEVCSRRRFAVPDAALHSAATLTVLAPLWRSDKTRDFLLGWAGHIAADSLTHREDARPLLWPLSRRWFRGPLSYRGKAFTVAEHALALAALPHVFRR
jgi:hypothetical protein